MPNVEATSPVIAGLNAASGAVAGVVQGYLQGRSLEMAQQARLDDAEYRDQLVRARNRELAQRAAQFGMRQKLDERQMDQRDREQTFREDQAREADRGVEEAGTYTADMISKSLGATTIADFESRMAAQRAAAVKFASTLGPRARAIVMAGVDDDERAERAALAQRAAKAAWEGVLTNPLLAQDASPMAEEIRALAKENMQELENGADTVAQSMRDLDQLRDLVTKKMAKAKDFEWGLGWAQQQIAEGGGDTSKMHSVLADFESMGPDQADLTALKRGILRAKHGVDLDTVKLGKIEVPRNVRVGSQEWMEIASSAADEEALDLMGKDPLIKNKIERGEFDGEDGERKYLDIRETFRKSAMRKYAAQSGATRAQMMGMGLLDSPKKVEANALSEIEKRLREAGIDPNMKVGAPSAPSSTRMDVQRRTPESGLKPSKGGETPNEPVQPGRQRVSSKGVNDGDVVDEADLEDVYGDG